MYKAALQTFGEKLIQDGQQAPADGGANEQGSQTQSSAPSQTQQQLNRAISDIARQQGADTGGSRGGGAGGRGGNAGRGGGGRGGR